MLRVQEGKVKESCKATVSRGLVSGSRCGNIATRDGYCGFHYPDAVARMRAKNAELLEQSRAELDTRRNAAIRARKLAELAERLIPAITGGTRGEWFGVAAIDEAQDILRELYEMRR